MKGGQPQSGLRHEPPAVDGDGSKDGEFEVGYRVGRGVGSGVGYTVGIGVGVGCGRIRRAVGFGVGVGDVGAGGGTDPPETIRMSAQFQNSSPNFPFPRGPQTEFSAVAQLAL